MENCLPAAGREYWNYAQRFTHFLTFSSFQLSIFYSNTKSCLIALQVDSYSLYSLVLKKKIYLPFSKKSRKRINKI
jgi:hypothetical protein